MVFIWKYRLNINFYKDEPRLLLIDFLRLIKSSFNKYFHKKEDKFDIYQSKQLRDRALSNEEKDKFNIPNFKFPLFKVYCPKNIGKKLKKQCKLVKFLRVDILRI